MGRHVWISGALVVSALIGSNPALVLAHGGGGGGGRGGGGGGGAIGGRGGAHVAGAHPGFGGYGYGYGGHPGYRTFGGYGYPGYGWRYGGYGWGYPYYGLGLGLGLGYGLGYGMGYGYGGYYGSPYYGYNGYSPYSYSGQVPYGYGVPAYGAGAYGSAPSGSPSGTTAPYNSNPNSSSPIDSTTPGPTPGSPPPSAGISNEQYGVVAASSNGTDVPPPPAPMLPAVDSQPAAAAEFSKRAEAAFRAGDYTRARHEWRHAAVDDPQNARLLLLLSQALFATGRFDEAAGAAQSAMRLLPKEEWGSVIARYPQLYGRAEDYTAQLHALEKAVHDKPRDPALRFLIGYHYTYLGFRKEAIDQFYQVMSLSPRDDIARELRKLSAESLAKTKDKPRS